MDDKTYSKYRNPFVTTVKNYEYNLRKDLYKSLDDKVFRQHVDEIKNNWQINLGSFAKVPCMYFFLMDIPNLKSV
jgi:hypothetical protein